MWEFPIFSCVDNSGWRAGSEKRPKNAKAPLKATTPPSRDPANAGIRQEPELPPQEDIAPVPKNPAQEFSFAAEKSDDEAARAELKRLQARGHARQVAMDPEDDLGL